MPGQLFVQKRKGYKDMHTDYAMGMEKKSDPLEGRQYIKNTKTGKITFLDDPKDADEIEM